MALKQRAGSQMRPTYTIHLDGSWTLEDLYKFPRAYEQAYFFVYAIETGGADYEGDDVDYLFRAFPWQGGYSTVGFYNSLKYRIRPSRRPTIISIKYASPGWLELGVVLTVALNIERIIKAFANSATVINKSYGDIIKGMQERKLRNIKIERDRVRLEREELKFINESNAVFCRLLGLKNLQALNEKTGSPLTTLKMLLSFYRRIKLLVDYKEKGKAEFNNNRQSLDND